MPSYLKPVEGDFKLDYESILDSLKVYGTITDNLSIKVDLVEIRRLIWGNETPRTFRLFKVH